MLKKLPSFILNVEKNYHSLFQEVKSYIIIVYLVYLKRLI